MVGTSLSILKSKSASLPISKDFIRSLLGSLLCLCHNWISDEALVEQAPPDGRPWWKLVPPIKGTEMRSGESVIVTPSQRTGIFRAVIGESVTK